MKRTGKVFPGSFFLAAPRLNAEAIDRGDVQLLLDDLTVIHAGFLVREEAIQQQLQAMYLTQFGLEKNEK